MDDDWRLLNDVEYLMCAEIEPTDPEELQAHRPELTHCVFCWDFVPGPAAYLQWWYVPLDKSCCICEKCFSDFRERFRWKLLDGWDIEW